MKTVTVKHTHKHTNTQTPTIMATMATEYTVMGLEGSGSSTKKGKDVAWPFWIKFLQFATFILDYKRPNDQYFAPGTIGGYFSRVKEKLKTKHKTWDVWIDCENTHQWVYKIRRELERKAAQRRHENGESLVEQSLPADGEMMNDVCKLLLCSKKSSEISMASVICTNWHRYDFLILDCIIYYECNCIQRTNLNILKL